MGAAKIWNLTPEARERRRSDADELSQHNSKDRDRLRHAQARVAEVKELIKGTDLGQELEDLKDEVKFLESGIDSRSERIEKLLQEAREGKTTEPQDALPGVDTSKPPKAPRSSARERTLQLPEHAGPAAGEAQPHEGGPIAPEAPYAAPALPPGPRHPDAIECEVVDEVAEHNLRERWRGMVLDVIGDEYLDLQVLSRGVGDVCLIRNDRAPSSSELAMLLAAMVKSGALWLREGIYSRPLPPEPPAPKGKAKLSKKPTKPSKKAPPKVSAVKPAKKGKTSKAAAEQATLAAFEAEGRALGAPLRDRVVRALEDTNKRRSAHVLATLLGESEKAVEEILRDLECERVLIGKSTSDKAGRAYELRSKWESRRGKPKAAKKASVSNAPAIEPEPPPAPALRSEEERRGMIVKAIHGELEQGVATFGDLLVATMRSFTGTGQGMPQHSEMRGALMMLLYGKRIEWDETAKVYRLPAPVRWDFVLESMARRISWRPLRIVPEGEAEAAICRLLEGAGALYTGTSGELEISCDIPEKSAGKMVMQTARDHLLDLLEEKPGQTAGELAALLEVPEGLVASMTAALVRSKKLRVTGKIGALRFEVVGKRGRRLAAAAE